MKAYITFMRPFTMLPPMVGVISGALTAWGSAHSLRGDAFGFDEMMLIVIASLAAGFLNAASNGINQICDLEIDRVNKPSRPLVTGAIKMGPAIVQITFLYIICVAITWVVVPAPQFQTWGERLTAPLEYHECIVFYLLAAIFTLIYSVPQLGRTKKMTLGANLTMAIPRGLMLKVAGWSVLASIWHWEPWFIGLVFFLFIFGAASTKDFSDMEGDRLGGCQTLPIRFGVRKAAYMIAPCFVIPWMLIPMGLYIKPDGQMPILTGDPILLWFLALSLITWGAYTVWLILRDPEALSTVENHPSWKHMYLMMMWAQVGFALAYIVDL